MLTANLQNFYLEKEKPHPVIASVAQLVERNICNVDVIGSNPVRGSKLFLPIREKSLNKIFKSQLFGLYL